MGITNVSVKLWHQNYLEKRMCKVKDPNGRFRIVSGTLNCVPVTQINVYGPNFDDLAFFQVVLSRIPDVDDTNIIMGGDFNCFMDALLDKQSSVICEQ